MYNNENDIGYIYKAHVSTKQGAPILPRVYYPDYLSVLTSFRKLIPQTGLHLTSGCRRVANSDKCLANDH